MLEDGVEQKIAAFSSNAAAAVDDVGALLKAAAPHIRHPHRHASHRGGQFRADA
jgi:hypothetical protein